MSPLREELPQVEIACTLTGPDAANRGREFAELGAAALLSRSKTDEGIVLVFAGDQRVEDEVRRLAAAESVCCSFLGFDIKTGDESIALTITGPPEARPVLDSLYSAVGA